MRAAIGVIAICDGIDALERSADPAVVVLAAGGLAVLSGISLLIGFLTPMASALLALGAIGLSLSRISLAAADPLESKPLTVLVAVVAVAVTLLGPGALSLDARLFGRREIIIPRMPRASNP